MHERLNHPASSSAADPERAPSPDIPLLSAQSGIYYAHQLAPRSTVLNTADLVEIDGPLDADLFTAALRRAVAEAETLAVRVSERGTVFPYSGSSPPNPWCTGWSRPRRRPRRGCARTWPARWTSPPTGR
ncbi:hypothetical protein SCALM49S_05626 [Streptomyces californicus]